MLPLLPTHWLTSKGRHQRGKIEMKKENEQRERERERERGEKRIHSLNKQTHNKRKQFHPKN